VVKPRNETALIQSLKLIHSFVRNMFHWRTSWNALTQLQKRITLRHLNSTISPLKISNNMLRQL